MVKIGLLGIGTVGSGVVNVLKKNKDIIRQRTNKDISIVAGAVKDITEYNKHSVCDSSDIYITEDAFEVVNNPDIDIVLELIGGIDIAKTLIETAIANKKHVISANKALIAHHGNGLLKLAKKNKVALLFEASVGGGIPIIKCLTQGLSANKIDTIVGIINGTGNFILTEMSKNDSAFTQVLQQAQQLGYAEEDPSFDIDGIDAAHKISILSSLAFNTSLAFNKVITKGISDITSQDIKFANELGYNIKHLGITKKINSLIEMRVNPALIAKSTLLANVNGVMNAILINANALGQTMYYGAGAGSQATASAVIADIIDIVNNTYRGNTATNNTAKYLTNDDIESIYYLHLLVTDKTGVLADISKILASYNISIESVIQHANNNSANIAIITNKIKTKAIKSAINDINNCNFTLQKAKMIHVESLT